MKNERKKFNKKSLLILLLLFLMVSTIGVSWAFWNAGIGVTDQNRDLDINIGEAGSVSTVLDITHSVNPESTLIPTTAPLRLPTDTHEIVFTVNVRWLPEDTMNSVDLDGIAGRLTVSLNEILIGGNDDFVGATNFLNATGLNGEPLFNMTVNYSAEDNPTYIPIAGGAPAIAVTITMTMNRPVDQAQYNLVAAQNARFVVNFAVDLA